MKSIVVACLAAVLMAACSPSDESEDLTLERTCEIYVDIAADAADGVDTPDETRERFRDLADGYGRILGGETEAALRAIVAALTTGTAEDLHQALNRMQRVCGLSPI